MPKPSRIKLGSNGSLVENLPEMTGCKNFINADLIADGL